MDILTYSYLSEFSETPRVTLETLFDQWKILIKLEQGRIPKIKGLQLFAFCLILSILNLANVANARILKKGDQGADVMALQEALQIQGFFSSTEKLTNYYGEKTEEAIKKFQENNSLTADGIAGEVTQLNLFEKISADQAEALLNQTETTNTDNTNNTQNKPQPQAQNTNNFAVLKKGDRSAEVTKLQQALKDQGYFPSNQTVTNYYGNVTEQAVKKFQQSKGLTVNGIAEKSTQEKLFTPNPETTSSETTSPETTSPETTNPETTSSHSTLKPRQTNSEVKKLQELLKTKGYFPKETKVTNFYGEITEKAVKKFQQDHGLKADGIVGQNTWEKLINSNSKPTQTPTVKPTTSTSENPENTDNTIDISLKAQANINLCRRVSIPTGGYLVIRLYPDSNAEEVDVLTNGIKVGIKDRGVNGWVPLMEGGYVSSKYLKQCN